MYRRSASLLAALALSLALGVYWVLTPAAHARPYSQVVDNAARGRFSASGAWGYSHWSDQRYGRNYRFAKPSRRQDPASFKVRVPRTARYVVYARWPADRGYSGRVRVGVRTVSGWRWVHVNQRRNGGRWMRLGVYRMEAGDRWRVRITRQSSTRGYVVADAVKVVRYVRRSSGGHTGADVLRVARSWLGVPYKYGGATRNGVDCSGLTMRVFGQLGVKLPHNAARQYDSSVGRKVSRSDLKRGFLVFGHASGYGPGITHVGILTGDGRMIHAPEPGTVVRYDKIPASWYHIVGVKRIFPPR
jgi:cell wall-associated NlpC family hydrolase